MSDFAMSDCTVQTGTMTWSATRLKTYLTCPRQFRYSYIDGVPAVPTAPLVFGRTLHEALCFGHECQMQTGQLPPLVELLAGFETLWQQALEKDQPFFRTGAPTAQQYEKTGREILRAYWLAPENATAPLAAELAFEVKVGDMQFAGVVDRVSEGETGLVIVDFKSGTRKPGASDLANNLQFTLYAFAVGRMMGQQVERVVHYHLRDGTRYDVVPTDEQFVWLLDKVVPQVARAVARGDFAPTPGFWCNWCDFRELCQAENARPFKEVR